MKKFLLTFFALFYLFSSIGFSSVQHYCRMMQNSVEKSDGTCCCSDDATTAESCHHIPSAAPTSESCCSVEEPQETPTETDATLAAIHAECCETHYTYTHVDDSTLAKIVELESGIEHCAALITAAENQHQIPVHKSATIFAPSLHVNLPLLI